MLMDCGCGLYCMLMTVIMCAMLYVDGLRLWAMLYVDGLWLWAILYAVAWTVFLGNAQYMLINKLTKVPLVWTLIYHDLRQNVVDSQGAAE